MANLHSDPQDAPYLHPRDEIEPISSQFPTEGQKE